MADHIIATYLGSGWFLIKFKLHQQEWSLNKILKGALNCTVIGKMDIFTFFTSISFNITPRFRVSLSCKFLAGIMFFMTIKSPIIVRN